MNIYKVAYLCGIYFRNKKIFEVSKFLRKSQQWSKEEISAYQLRSLKKIVSHAYENCLYYRDKFLSLRIHPKDIKNLDDINNLPISTKDDIRNNSDKIQNFKCPEKYYYSETSGSTGRPLVFYRNARWDAFHRASVYRGCKWHDVYPWERNGYLWGYNFSTKNKVKTYILDSMQNRFRLFRYDEKNLIAFLKKLRSAQFLSGYSSMIYELAKIVNSKPEFKEAFKLKMIKATSEKIYDIYRGEIKRAFGKEVVSEYGAAETGIIAFSCKNGNMHINMESVIVESKNDEIVVTNLVSDSFPIIRYKLGDYIKLGNKTECTCGLKTPIIEEVTGRIGTMIYGKKDKYPSLTIYYVFKNLANKNIILNYQVIQEKKGFLLFKIENNLNQKIQNLLRTEIYKYFKNDMNIEIVDNSSLKSVNKKKQDFISLL